MTDTSFSGVTTKYPVIIANRELTFLLRHIPDGSDIAQDPNTLWQHLVLRPNECGFHEADFAR